jgi:MarR family multiple antibiotic resistance transcriptional regulator
MTEDEIDTLVDNFTTLVPVFMRMIKQIQYEILQDKDISSVHLQIMFILKHNGELNMSKLGEIIMVPKPNVTVFIDKLITLGFVERVYNDSDRRAVLVKLTDEGRKYLACHLEEMKKYFKDMIKNYSGEDKVHLKTISVNLNYFIDKYKSRKEKDNG